MRVSWCILFSHRGVRRIMLQLVSWSNAAFVCALQVLLSHKRLNPKSAHLSLLHTKVPCLGSVNTLLEAKLIKSEVRIISLAICRYA